MFKAFHGPLGDEFLTDEHDPTGAKRMLRRELDLLCNAADSEAMLSEGERFEVTVNVKVSDNFIESLRNRYRDIFEIAELDEMADIIEEFVASSQRTAEAMKPEDDSEEAFGANIARHAIIAASVAVAQSLQQLFHEEIGNRVESSAANGVAERPNSGAVRGNDEDEGWPERDDDDEEDDEKWDIGTVMDPEGAISDHFSASAIGDDDELVSGANDIVLDEEILEAAMDVDVNMKDVAQSFDAIHSYLDEHLAQEGIAETSPEYQNAHVALMHAVRDLSKGTITLRKLLELREHPAVARILDPLVGDEASCCFSSVFHDVAQAALYDVKKFSDMVDAKILEEEVVDSQRIEDIVFAYAVELVTRNGLA